MGYDKAGTTRNFTKIIRNHVRKLLEINLRYSIIQKRCKTLKEIRSYIFTLLLFMVMQFHQVLLLPFLAHLQEFAL